MNLTEGLCCLVLGFAIVWGAITLIYNVGIWRAPCVNVYNDGELIYSGTNWVIRTETRGSATYYSQIEQKKWFPKQIKEIVSDKITIETTTCKK